MLVDRRLRLALSVAALARCSRACAQEKNPPFVGSLEWDRVAVTAELAEPVLRWDVAEGDRVEAGAVLLEQDPRRQDARIAEAHGNFMQAEAQAARSSRTARESRRSTPRARTSRRRTRSSPTRRWITTAASSSRSAT